VTPISASPIAKVVGIIKIIFFLFLDLPTYDNRQNPQKNNLDMCEWLRRKKELKLSQYKPFFI